MADTSANIKKYEVAKPWESTVKEAAVHFKDLLARTAKNQRITIREVKLTLTSPDGIFGPEDGVVVKSELLISTKIDKSEDHNGLQPQTELESWRYRIDWMWNLHEGQHVYFNIAHKASRTAEFKDVEQRTVYELSEEEVKEWRRITSQWEMERRRRETVETFPAGGPGEAARVWTGANLSAKRTAGKGQLETAVIDCLDECPRDFKLSRGMEMTWEETDGGSSGSKSTKQRAKIAGGSLGVKKERESLKKHKEKEMDGARSEKREGA